MNPAWQLNSVKTAGMECCIHLEVEKCFKIVLRVMPLINPDSI